MMEGKAGYGWAAITGAGLVNDQRKKEILSVKKSIFLVKK